LSTKKVLVLGCGGIGSRYLQGLCSVEDILTIGFDPSEVSLGRCKDILGKVVSKKSEVYLTSSLNDIPKDIFLCINAVTANLRKESISMTENIFYSQYWILEKVLCQTINDLSCINKLLKTSKGTWINTPRTSMELYKKVKQLLIDGCNSNELEITVKGSNWGLACNSIHYIDLISWLTNEKLNCINTDQLEKWGEAKRKGFYETNGTLHCDFSGGTTLKLIDIPSEVNQTLVINKNNACIQINETTGDVTNEMGLLFHKPIVYQSKLTEHLVKNFLKTKSFPLIKLEESIYTHKILIEALTSHWVRQFPKKVLQIT